MPSQPLTPRKRPVQSRSRVTHDAILEAAAQVLVAGGEAAVTTGRVAERAGVSIGSLYQYFPNRTVLLCELVRASRAEMLADLEAAIAEETDLETTLRKLLSAAVAHHARAPELTAALERVERHLPLDAETVALNTRIGALVAARLERLGIADPLRVALDVAAMARALVDVAVDAGETDMEPVRRRLEHAARGYLGLS